MPYADPEKRRASAARASAKHYRKHRKERLAAQSVKNKRQREKHRKFVQDYKTNHPCSDCGHTYHFSCMEFDHQKHRGTKRGNIADLVNKLISLQKLFAEMEKCDLVCANCHRLRTWKRLLKARKKPATG